MHTTWEDFDQAELDRQYDTSRTVASPDAYFDTYARESERVRAALDCRCDLAYGSRPREVLDLFTAPRPGAPVLVFIHGGYWRRLHKDFFSFVAEPFVAAGAAVAVPAYELAPNVTIDEIVLEMRSAVAWLHHNVAGANGDPNRIVVAGHSAGGHLAAMAAGTDWREFGLAVDPIAAIVPISGVFDLAPIRRSFINETIQLDEAAAARNSPMRHLPRARKPLIAAVGGGETAEFIRQTHAFADAWARAGGTAQTIVVPDRNHYDVILDLQEPRSVLTRAILELLA